MIAYMQFRFAQHIFLSQHRIHANVVGQILAMNFKEKTFFSSILFYLS